MPYGNKILSISERKVGALWVGVTFHDTTSIVVKEGTDASSITL